MKLLCSRPPRWCSGKESSCQCRRHVFDSWVGIIPWRRKWLPTLVFLPRDSQESSPAPQFESINTSALSFLYGPTFIPIHDYQKNHSFDCTDMFQQSDVSAFQYAIQVCHKFPSKEQVSFNLRVAVTIHSDQIIFDYLQKSGLIMVNSTERLLATTLSHTLYIIL